MNQQKSFSTGNKRWQALSGVLFAAFFLCGDIVRGMLTSAQLLLPGAPATDVARYFNSSQTAVLAVAGFQILSAVSLFIFVACVVAYVRDAQTSTSTLPDFSRAGGLLAVVLLLVCALLASGASPWQSCWCLANSARPPQKQITMLRSCHRCCQEKNITPSDQLLTSGIVYQS